MMKKHTFRNTIILFLLGLLLAASMMGCREESKEEGEYTSLSELSGKRLGVQTGTILDKMAKDRIPDAKLVYFSTFLKGI